MGVGVGLAHPPPATLISTEVVVLDAGIAADRHRCVTYICPAGNERCWFRVGPLVQLLVAGSYICRVFVVSGLNSRVNDAPTPFFASSRLSPGR